MATEYRTNRIETADRWQKALERAVANGIESFRIAGSGEFVVTSSTKLDTVYRCDAHSCECEAGLAGDPVCQHRAVVRFVLGCFNQPALTPQTVECGACHGRGWHYVETYGGHGFPDQVACRRCGGTGAMPIPSRVPVPAAPVTEPLGYAAD